jgi:glycosidase
MNTENPAVETYLRQNAQWWIEEAGADALRIDTFAYIPHPFWNAYLGELQHSYPRLTEVGENVDRDPVIVSSFAGGVTWAGEDTKLYTPFDFPTFFALRDALRNGAPLKKIADTMADDSLYPHPERLVVFFDNHDNARFLDGGRSLAAMKLAYAFVMTTRGTPQLYYGDEIAMAGGEDPDNRRDFPGGFTGAKNDAFTEAGRSKEQQEMFLWGVRLGELRRRHRALNCGGEQILAAADDWLVYLRDTKHSDDASCAAGPRERDLVAIHRGEGSNTFRVPIAHTWMEGCSLHAPELSGTKPSVSMEGGALQLTMSGDDVFVAGCQ